MSQFVIVARRSGLVESWHRLHVAVTDADGRVVAAAGDPHLATFWRSSAKPFQALPLAQDGVLERFGLDDRALALACASHSSEPAHAELAAAMLAASGSSEAELACGPHVPLSPAVAAAATRGELALGPRHSNCSGKHAGMLALARAHGWPAAGYERRGHPVQERILREVLRWTGLPPEAVRFGVDGCTAVSFHLPLAAMATAYARLAASAEPAARRVVQAMVAHPELVAGTGRACTDLMRAGGGRLVAKIGADGVYGAAILPQGLGIAIKVESGVMAVVPAALVAVLEQLDVRWGLGLAPLLAEASVRRHGTAPIHDTRGHAVGEVGADGALRFPAPVCT